MAAATVYSSIHPSVKRTPSITLPRRSILSIAAAQHPACHPLRIPSSTHLLRRRPGHPANYSFSYGPNSTGDWNPPERVDNFTSLVDEACRSTSKSGGKNHWFVIMDTGGVEFDTEESLFDFYIKILASVVGSEEHAKKKIYLVSCEWRFGFGAEIDVETKYKLEVQPGVTVVLEDYYYATRRKDLEVRSVSRFTPVDMNHRIDDIYSYHHLSKRNSKWNSDHWLVHIKQPDGEFSNEEQTIDFCIAILAEVVGSDAKEKIYIVWSKTPLGFAAEIDKETSNKLKGRPDVLIVLPDYAYDVKNKDRGVLVISSSSHLEAPWSYYYTNPSEYTSEDSEDSTEEDFEDSDDSMEEPVNEYAYSIFSPKMSECIHWFVTMEKPGGEFASMQQTIDYYVKTLATVIGSEEAKEKIYRVKCEEPFFGFAANIDKETSNKLKGSSGVLAVFPDYLFNKNHKEPRVQSVLRELAIDFKEWRVEPLPQ